EETAASESRVLESPVIWFVHREIGNLAMVSVPVPTPSCIGGTKYLYLGVDPVPMTFMRGGGGTGGRRGAVRRIDLVDQHPAVGHTARARRLEVDLPPHVVAGEEGRIAAGIQMALEFATHLGRPVFVVPHRHEKIVGI